MRINEKTIVITGAGNGIGRELTLALLRQDARVAAVDISENALNDTAGLAGSEADRLSLHCLDITDQAAVAALPEAVITAHQQVDGIINNAGIIQPFVRVNNLEYPQIERVMNINFYGTLYMIKAFLPHLLKRPEASITNISSMGGFLPVPGQSVYGASKAAVKLLTEGLNAELQGTGVSVTLVFPGAIATNITENSGVEIKQLKTSSGKASDYKAMPAPEAAEQIIDGMERGKARVFVGSDSKMMNLLYRLSPGYAVNMITKRMQSLLQ